MAYYFSKKFTLLFLIVVVLCIADKPHTSRQNSSSIPKTNSQAPGALQETRGHSDSPTLLSLKLLGIQLQQLIRDSGLPCVLLDELPNLYLTAYGSKLRPERYNCTSLSTLIEKLRNYIHVRSVYLFTLFLGCMSYFAL